MRDSNEESMSH